MPAPVVQEIEVPLTRGGRRPGVLALPEAAGPRPGVVVLHDILGLTADTRRHCRRFAEAGYAALAPDLYDDRRPRCVVSTVMAMVRERGPAHGIVADARRALAARPEVDEGRIGITGFCMGGGFALLAAADDAYAVAAPFYGSVPRSAARLRGACPTLAQYGALDASFVGHARRLARHLEALGVPHEVLVHPGVGHSFMNDHPGSKLFALGARLPMHAAYDPETERRAWARLLTFFDDHMPAAAKGASR